MGRHSQWVCSGLACLSSPDIWVTKLRGTCPSPQPGDEALAQDGLGLSRPGASLPIFSPATEGDAGLGRGGVGLAVSVGVGRGRYSQDKDVN